MRLVPYSYDGHVINDGGAFKAYFPAEHKWMPESSSIVAKRARRWPVITGSEVGVSPFLVKIKPLGNFYSQRDTIKTWLPTDSQVGKMLVAYDIDDGNRQWYVYGKVTRLLLDKGIITAVLDVGDPCWQTVLENHVAWNITATGQTQTITPIGLVNARARMVFTPTQAKGGGYAFKKWYPITNPGASIFTDLPFDITGGLDTATLVGASKCQSDGDDLRVMIDNSEVDRWLGSMNTASTKVWVNLSLNAKTDLILGNNISGVGPITEIVFKKGSDTQTALKKLPQQGTFLSAGGEAFTYAAIDLKNNKATGVTRTVKGTVIGAHTAGEVFKWVEHDIWLLYGNASATAPVTNDAKKPAFNLNSSSNTSWVYDTSFFDDAGIQTGGWKGSISAGKNGVIYTGPQCTFADPASDVGLAILAYMKGTRWYSETQTLQIKLYHPAGFTTVTATGTKFKHVASNGWPREAQFQKSANGRDWSIVWNETAPSALDTYEAWAAHNAVALTTNPPYVQFHFSGSVSASDSNYAVFQVDAVTLAIRSAGLPVIVVGVEQGNYYLDALVTNTSYAEAFSLRYWLATARSLTLDTIWHEVTYDDGSGIYGALSYPPRDEILDLRPGANVIQFDDAGTAGLTVDFYWRDRAIGL
jgi:hypothetical protein